MRKLKRIAALMLVGVMFIAAVTACSSSHSNGQEGIETSASTAGTPGTIKTDESLEEKMEISVALWGMDETLANNSNDQFLKEMYTKLNITLKPRRINWDDYTQKAQIWTASGDMPDILSIDAVGTAYYRNWINKGVIRALPEDLSKYPTLSRYLDKSDIQLLKEKGKLYNVPRSLYDSLDYCAHDRNVFYRWDIAQKAGITREPATWEEFKAMLKTIVEKDPEGKDISGLTVANVKLLGGFFWLYSNPAATSDGSGGDFKWIKEDGRYIPAVLSTKLALPSLQNAREMYEEGLIDQDIGQLKGEQAYEKFASGEAAAILEVGFGNLDAQVNHRWKKLYPGKPLMDAVKRIDYFPSTDGTRYHAVFKKYWSESYFSSKVDDKKMDRIMRLYDWMLQPDTKEFYRFGVKGVDYRKDGDKIIRITSQTALDKKQPSSSSLEALVEFDNQFGYDPNNLTIDPAISKAARDDLAYSRRVTRAPDYEEKLTYISTPTKDRFSILDYDFILKIMMGREPVDKMWDDVLKDYESKGLGKMIDEVNAEARGMGLK